jgi:hypothetical protein
MGDHGYPGRIFEGNARKVYSRWRGWGADPSGETDRSRRRDAAAGSVPPPRE